MSEDSPLDPQHYVAHVTRTAMLLEQLAKDVHALREQAEARDAESRSLRQAVTSLERDLAVYKAENSAFVKGNHEIIESVVEKLKWLSRLVIGALLTGIIGGAIALIFKLVAR